MCCCEVVEWQGIIRCVGASRAEFMGKVCGCRTGGVYSVVELCDEIHAVWVREKESRDGEEGVVEGDCVEWAWGGDGF